MKTKFLILALFLCIRTTFGTQRTNPLDSLSDLLKTSLSDSARGRVLTEIGTFQMDNGNFPSAISNFLKSLTIFEKLEDDKKIFDVMNRLAIVYSHTGNNKVALEYLTKCKYNLDDGRLYDNFGLVHYQLQDYDKSLLYYNQSLNFYKQKSNKIPIARLLNNIGSIYELKNDKVAESYYLESLKVSEELNDKISIVDALASLGDSHFKRKDYLQSKTYEEKSLKIATEINYIMSIMETEFILSKIDSALNRPVQSLEHYKKYIEAKNKILDESKIKEIVKIEENFKFEKEKQLIKSEQDKKDLLKEQQLIRQRNQKIFFIVGFGIVLCFSIFLFLTFKKTQRQKHIIEEQKKSVEESKKEITDNIRYAKRIQDAVMTPLSTIKENVPNSFVLNMARDTVSGDFLFLERYKDEIIVAVADCTNHSVSGAMMSILCNNLLSEAITNGNHIPSDILNYVNTSISKKFHQTETDNTKKELDIVKDGMDVAIVKIDLVNMKYQYAGAYNPLIILRGNEITEVKADKLQLGQTKMQYKNNMGELQKNDMLYMSSDGYADQFSSSGKKFMKKKFKELLVSVNQKNTSEQKSILEQTIYEWKNGHEQTDDILVMGIKI